MSTAPRTSQSKEVRATSGTYTVAVALVAAVGGLMFGYDIGVIADAKEGIRKSFDLGTFQIEVVVAAVLAGSFAGALVAGRLCDRIGRRWTNVWGGALFGVGCLGCCLSVDFTMVTGFRVVMGLGVGFSSVAGPLYIAEIAAPWSRGAMVSLYQLAITLGIFIAFLIGLVLGEDHLWRLHFAIGVSMGVGLVLGMLAMPPSPRWLVGRGRMDTALGVLKRTMGSVKAANAEFEAIKIRVREESGERLLDALRSNVAVRRALILAIGLAVLQQFSGINAIMFYGPEIIKEIGLGSSALMLTAAIGLINVLATFIAIWLVDRLGRRVLLLVGTGLMMAAQIGIGVVAFWIPTGPAGAESGVPLSGVIALILIFIAIIAFAFSLGPLVWLIISEIFPAGVRSACVGIATAANWTGAFLVALFTLTVLENNALGTTTVFWLFAGSNIVAILFVLWRLPETKGVELEQIEDFFTDHGKKAR